MNLRLTIRTFHKNKLSKKHIASARIKINKKGINLTIGKNLVKKGNNFFFVNRVLFLLLR